MISGQQTILIVEDMHLNREMLKNILEEDYQIVCAQSAAEAVDMITYHTVDLILLDIVLPDIDGYKLCGWLKSNYVTQHIPVIFLTIKDKPQDQVFGFSIGANDYVTKSTDPSVIKARVKHQLEVKEERDNLLKLSFIDGLTGIANRRYFDESFDKFWNSALRQHEFLSILLVDIDFFKQYNDLYGHVAGDQCLKKVAQALDEALFRSLDIVTRYGGEEFMILLPTTTCTGATQVAERIQEKLRLLNIKHQMSEVNELLTVSIGAATVQPTKEFDPQSFVKRADYALYRAKSEGRNRFVVITE